MNFLPQKHKEINIDVNNSLDILLKSLEALDEIRESQDRIEAKLDLLLLDRDNEDVQLTFGRGVRVKVSR